MALGSNPTTNSVPHLPQAEPRINVGWTCPGAVTSNMCALDHPLGLCSGPGVSSRSTHNHLSNPPWNRLLRSSSKLSSTMYHPNTHTPARALRGVGESGANNATSATSCFAENTRWSVGARTSHRIQTESPRTPTMSNSKQSAVGVTPHSSPECSSYLACKGSRPPKWRFPPARTSQHLD